MHSKIDEPKKPIRAVTLRDVAEAANVSTAAVSKVLHGGGASIRVSQERAELIRSVAESLNYRANAVARNLRTSRTRTIGVFFENLTSLTDGPLYTSDLIDGVASVLFKHHYRLTLLADIDHSDVAGSLGDGQLEGVIWCKLARDAETVKVIRRIPIPIVAFNAAAPDASADTVFVNCDNEGGMDVAIDHLWSLDHRRIAFLCEWEERETPDCAARRESYIRAVCRRGGEPIVITWPWALDGLVDHLATQGVSAVACWSESIAGRLLLKLKEAGISVPRDLSVIGFDSTLYCETTKPRLTAVRQPIRDMGAYATQTLLSLISGAEPSRFSKVFPCTLDVRDSTTVCLKAEVTV